MPDDIIRRNREDGSVTWTPPVSDAADVIIDRLNDLKTVEPLEGFSEEELYLQKQKQLFYMRRDEEYTGFETRGSFDEIRALEKRSKGKRGVGARESLETAVVE